MDDVRDSIFLKQADGSDAGGSGFETRGGVFESNSAQSKNRDFRLAGFA